MEISYHQSRTFNQLGSTSAEFTMQAASRDFITLDGRLIPMALGEEALRQRTALLVGGVLIGHWPEQM